MHDLFGDTAHVFGYIAPGQTPDEYGLLMIQDACSITADETLRNERITITLIGWSGLQLPRWQQAGPA